MRFVIRITETHCFYHWLFSPYLNPPVPPRQYNRMKARDRFHDDFNVTLGYLFSQLRRIVTAKSNRNAVYCMSDVHVFSIKCEIYITLHSNCRRAALIDTKRIFRILVKRKSMVLYLNLELRGAGMYKMRSHQSDIMELLIMQIQSELKPLNSRDVLEC